MTTAASQALGPAQTTSAAPALPNVVQRAGQAAVFAAEEFFYGTIRNPHTRLAYRRAVHQFLAWCESRGLEGGTFTSRVKSRLEKEYAFHLAIFHGHGSAG